MDPNPYQSPAPVDDEPQKRDDRPPRAKRQAMTLAETLDMLFAAVLNSAGTESIMTSEPMKTIRWRPRFSLRTLVIFVTLVCAYFGAWEATKKWGVPKTPTALPGKNSPAIVHAHSPFPFIVCQEEGLFFWEVGGHNLGDTTYASAHQPDAHRYYLWVFGLKIKLPFESERTIVI